MKKSLLSLCLILTLGMMAQAQTRWPHPPRRSQPKRARVERQPRHHIGRAYYPTKDFQFHVIGEIGVRDFDLLIRHDYPYHFSIGGMAEYQLGKFTSFGIGAEYYSSYGEECQLLRNMQETYIHTLPIYANLRLSLRDAPVFPFIEGRIGYSAPLGEVTCNDYNGVHHYMSTGLYTGCAFGVKIYHANISFGMAVIDIVDCDQGFNSGRKDVISDYYARLSLAF